MIIDQNLPATDGSKLAALFRGNPGMRAIRVVLVSGSEGPDILELAQQAGIDAFVSKREMHSQLVPTVKRVLA